MPSHPNTIALKADPLPSLTLAGSLLAMAAAVRWQNAKPSTAEVLRKYGEPDAQGCWGGSTARTIEALFAWSLLGSPDARTARAVDWLLEAGDPPMQNQCYFGLFFKASRADLFSLVDVPFTKGCTGFIKTGAALYFATVFDQGDECKRDTAIQTLSILPPTRGGRFCSAPCSNNIVQAFASHLRLRGSRAMKPVLERFESDQLPNGAFAGDVPFYPTLNALAKIDSPIVRRIFHKALPRIAAAQRKDGSWGKPINTYLVLDALDQQGITWR